MQIKSLLKFFFWILMCVPFAVFSSQNVRAATSLPSLLKPNIKNPTLEVTGHGFYIGEYDTRLWLNPPNNVTYSGNGGNTYISKGLTQRGITSISWNNNNQTLFASTYYSINGSNGLFRSRDKGGTWEHLSGNISTKRVKTSYINAENVVFLGTYKHGLWSSRDNGDTWNQVLGDGYFGPEIFGIDIQDNYVVFSTRGATYISTNYGSNFSNIPELVGETCNNLKLNDKYIYCGTTSGIWYSSDFGQTWQKQAGTNNKVIGPITIFRDKVLFSQQDNTGVYRIITAPEDLSSLEDMNVTFTNEISDLSTLYTQVPYLLIAVNNEGIYRFPLDNNSTVDLGTFDIPWRTANPNDLIDKITAYFDHEYPLLGYSLKSEEDATANTTLNFYGTKDQAPNIYYSSHNGTDWGLPFGTPIVAPEAGLASYYYCTDCGNTIKIVHPNGIQTSYMHLQSKGLLTFKSTKMEVNKGDVIGLVGMTGRTTGPHLHLSASKDANNNNIYEDDYPEGLFDPFGWMSKDKRDPWEGLTWSDALGSHTGTASQYIWKQIPNTLTYFWADTEPQELEIENIKIKIPGDLFDYGVGIKFQPTKAAFLDRFHSYIPYTSFELLLTDQSGNKIGKTDKEIGFELKLEPDNLTKIIPETIQIYHLNTTQQPSIWEKVSTTFNSQNLTIYFESKTFSQFAAFGLMSDTTPPVTQLLITGTENKGWYDQYPTISFNTNEEDNTNTFYSIDNAFSWEKYEKPFTYIKEGVNAIDYKSTDRSENWEETNTILIHTRPTNSATKTIKVINTKITTTTITE